MNIKNPGEIGVKDNGNGMLDKIKEKISPTLLPHQTHRAGNWAMTKFKLRYCESTGGELKVETNESLGSEFIIIIPAV